MKHYDLEAWTDFARQVRLDPEIRAAMDTHLEGCAECRRTVMMLESVRDDAQALAGHAPPDGAVRSVHAFFGLQQPARPRRWRIVPLEIAYDSQLAPAPAGVRSGGGGARVMTCHSDRYAVDLMTDRGISDRENVLTGQLVSAEQGPLSEIPAFVVSKGRILSSTFTGPTGDFELTCKASDALRLCLVVDDDHLLDLDLDATRH